MDGGWRTEYYQARRVALTEVLRAHAVAHEESIQQSPATDRKEWVHTGAHKNEPRQNHIDMSGQIVLKNQPFTLHSVDGDTYYPMHPLDIILPACESVNCHCIHRESQMMKSLECLMRNAKRCSRKLSRMMIVRGRKNSMPKTRQKSGIKSKEKEGSKPKYDYAASKIDRKQIASAEYQNKFNALWGE